MKYFFYVYFIEKSKVQLKASVRDLLMENQVLQSTSGAITEGQAKLENFVFSEKSITTTLFPDVTIKKQQKKIYSH